MAAISTAILAGTALVSAGVGVAGYMKQKSASEDAVAAAQGQTYIAGVQAQKSAEFAGKEAELTSEASRQSYEAALASQAISEAEIRDQQGIEAQKRLAMEADARSNMRSVIRQQQRDRALGLTTVTAQGAGRAGGSALGGVYGQISGGATTNLKNIQTGLSIGRSIFDYNFDISNKRIMMGELQTQYAGQQADITTRQAKLKAEYAGVQADLTTASSQYGGQLATAQGESQYGGALIQAAQSIFAVGQVGARIAPSIASFGGQSLFSAYSGGFMGSGSFNSRYA